VSIPQPHFQIVVCNGPRCRARGQVGRHLAHVEARAGEPQNAGRVGVACYECLSRCPAGPNVLVRNVAPGDDASAPPGMLDLDGGAHYRMATIELLDRIVDEHCQGKPVVGRYQRY